MTDTLLRKLEAEQAAGWPSPPTWSVGDVYPDPLLACYVTTIQDAVNAARRSNTCAHRLAAAATIGSVQTTRTGTLTTSTGPLEDAKDPRNDTR